MAATQKGHPGDINGSGKGETELRAHTWYTPFSHIYIYKVVISVILSVCLFICPIITQEPLGSFALNFDAVNLRYFNASYEFF